MQLRNADDVLVKTARALIGPFANLSKKLTQRSAIVRSQHSNKRSTYRYRICVLQRLANLIKCQFVFGHAAPFRRKDCGIGCTQSGQEHERNERVFNDEPKEDRDPLLL